MPIFRYVYAYYLMFNRNKSCIMLLQRRNVFSKVSFRESRAYLPPDYCSDFFPMLLSIQVCVCFTGSPKDKSSVPKQNAAQHPGPAAPATHTLGFSCCWCSQILWLLSGGICSSDFILCASAASALRSIPSAHPLPGLKDCMYVSLRSRGNSS